MVDGDLLERKMIIDFGSGDTEIDSMEAEEEEEKSKQQP